MGTFFAKVWQVMKIVYANGIGVLGTYLSVFLIIPLLLLFVSIPLVTVLYVAGAAAAGDLILWSVAFYVVTALFVFWVSDVIVLKVLRDAVNVAAAIPEGGARLFGTHIELGGISDDYISKFKRGITDSFTWVMFFVLFVAVLPMHRWPPALPITYVLFLALATRQEGWAKTPPVVARALAGLFMMLVLLKVLMLLFIPKTWERITGVSTMLDDVLYTNVDFSLTWAHKQLSIGDAGGTPDKHTPSVALAEKEWERSTPVLSSNAAHIRTEMSRLLQKERERRDFELEQSSIRVACNRGLTTDDLSDEVVYRAFTRFCEQ